MSDSLSAADKSRPAQRPQRFLFSAACAFTVLLYGFIYWIGRRGLQDFSNAYVAGKIIASGRGHELYSYALQRQLQAELHRHAVLLFYLHAPFEALLFVPLAFLPISLAYAVWFAASLALLVIGFCMLRPHLTNLQPELSLVLMYVAVFAPLWECFLQGQDSILFLFLWTACFVALSAGRDAKAGCILALASFKPQFLLPVVIAFLLTRRWKFLAAFSQTALVLFLVSLAIVGWRGMLEFRHLMAAFTQLPAETSGWHPEVMPNVRGFFLTMLPPNFPHSWLDRISLATSVTLIAAAVAIYVRYAQRFFVLAFALLVAAVPVTSYYGHTYEFVILLLPILLMMNYWAAAPFGWRKIVLGALPFTLLALFPYLFWWKLAGVFFAFLAFPAAIATELLLLARHPQTATQTAGVNS